MHKKQKSMQMPKPKPMLNDAEGDEPTMYAYLNAEGNKIWTLPNENEMAPNREQCIIRLGMWLQQNGNHGKWALRSEKNGRNVWICPCGHPELNSIKNGKSTKGTCSLYFSFSKSFDKKKKGDVGGTIP